MANAEQGVYVWGLPSKKHMSADVSMTPAVDPSVYNSNYLKNDTGLRTPCPTYGPPQLKKEGSDLYGHYTARAYMSQPVEHSRYNSNYLKTASTIVSPAYIPYSKDVAQDNAFSKDIEAKEPLNYTQLAQLMYATTKKPEWGRAVENLSKIEMTEQIRPLRPTEAQKRREIHAMIDIEREKITSEQIEAVMQASSQAEPQVKQEPKQEEPVKQEPDEIEEGEIEDDDDDDEIEEFKEDTEAINRWLDINSAKSYRLEPEEKKKYLTNEELGKVIRQFTGRKARGKRGKLIDIISQFLNSESKSTKQVKELIQNDSLKAFTKRLS